MKNIAILGSTGSIGTQALDVVRANKDKFKVEVLTAFSNIELLAAQAVEFDVNTVVIQEESKYEALKSLLSNTDIKVFCGEEALADVVTYESVEIVLTALVGYAGLKPTISAIKAKKNIALANKETLVVAGDLITKLAEENNVHILPVDSEHSAIFQCLAGEWHNPIEKIVLTASGGPFRGKTTAELAHVTRVQALKHPNWVMGAKITIDSASLMNKGLEVIEAKWLFNLDPKQIEVIVHPQSIVHSIVQFQDGSMKAQMGLPDMKLPIQYALAYPHRIVSDFPRFNFMDYPALTFEQADVKTFRNLGLAFNALYKGGNMACILNAANEIAVEAFLKDKIGFLAMSDLLEKCMEKITFIANPNYEEYVNTDKETRIFATELVSRIEN
ncbi:MAG: 1-deoxy-D-xylulose-5-phosphate reductoisomerase [Sphingobacteriales bacterium]|nr:1-deoxy-D-xylulose-5-phosphate reductoisomerase [Sphingobacteriales bacterium]